MTDYYPFLILAVGLTVVIGGIVLLRVNAFLSLVAAAMVVSLMAPGGWSTKISRVAEAFGSTAASIGIVIALAAVIGKAMTESGAADRIVQAFVHWLGEERGASALMASGFTLAIPVFYDTVFYLLVPLARSMYRRTGKHYVRYLIAVASCAVAHAMVPPTPGPLLVAATLDIDLGVMMLVGSVVALPAAIASLWFAAWADRRMPNKTPSAEDHDSPEITAKSKPSLAWSLAPIVLPVVLITLNTAYHSLFSEDDVTAAVLAILGNPNLALLLSAAVALWTLWTHCRPTQQHFANAVEQALMSGGLIVLITSAGGAFGEMLKVAQLAPAIEAMFGDSTAGGLGILFLSFAIASLMKFAQGSSTAAMIVASAMIAAMIGDAPLGVHRVYVATAIGSGSLVGSWMNDSGFWIFAKMGGLTELETLQTWTPLLVLLGVVSMAMTLLLAVVFPLVSF